MAPQRSVVAVTGMLAAVLAAAMPLGRTASAQSADTRARVGRSPWSRHVHALDGPFDARSLLETALERSATIRRLVATLDASDLMVYVVVQFDLKTGSGDLHLLPAVPGIRRVLIRIDASNDIPNRFKVLGHELQHAVEVASAPDVNDTAGMLRLYRRIGTVTAGGFETDAAVHTGHVVYSEVFGRGEKNAAEPPRREREQRK